MNRTIYFYMLAVLAISLGGCVTVDEVQPPRQNIGLTTYSAISGKPVLISENTPVLKYNNRLYYFFDNSELKQFKDMPEAFLMKYNMNEIPSPAKPFEADYHLRTYCSFNGDPIAITEYTPAVMYMGRIYYFAHSQGRDMFMQDPQGYIAKLPANQVPKIISPLKTQYGTKTVCATTGSPLLVGPHTPALEYMGRIFYFSDTKAMEDFQKDPQCMVTKPFNNETGN